MIWLSLALALALLGMMVMLHRQMDHVRRIERTRAGLSEAPRKKRPSTPKEEPLPENVRSLIEPWGSPSVRRQLEEDCRALRKRGVPWKEIRRMLEVDGETGRTWQ